MTDTTVARRSDFDRRLRRIDRRRLKCTKMLADIWDKAHFNPANRPEDGSRLPYPEYIKKRDEYREAKEHSELYRDKTARMHIELEQDYPEMFAVQDWPESSVGDAEQIAVSYPPNTKEWLAYRVNTLGGSDFGSIICHHYDDDPWDNFIGVSECKIYGEDLDDAPWADEEAGLLGPQEGPLFRGNAYEQAIAKSFEHDWGDQYSVYITKDQFRNTHRSWQQLNFDGILIDKATGVRGILEIKNVTELDVDYLEEVQESIDPLTGLAHSNYIPTAYRGQVLYYLNGTNSQFAIIRMRFNDSIVIDFMVRRDDPVHRTGGMTVDEFVSGPLRRYNIRWKMQRRKLGVTPKSLLNAQRE